MLEVKGYSSSGVGTCLTVMKPYQLVLDMGFTTPESFRVQTVLLTHSHLDHVAGVVSHAITRGLVGAKPSRFVCSSETALFVKEMLEVCSKYQPLRYTIVEVNPDEELCLGQNLYLKAFANPHRVASQGYALVRKKRVFREEFNALSPDEKREYRQTVAPEYKETVLLVYMGDTLSEGLLHPLVAKAEALVTECTFVGSYPVEKAREKGHTHVKELVEILPRLQAKEVYLMHFSQRHGRAELREALEALPPHVKGLTKGGGPVRGW